MMLNKNSLIRTLIEKSHLAVLTLVLILPVFVMAQSGENTNNDDQTRKRPAIPDAPSERAGSETDEKNDDVFNPTEEISEDLPVPFPIDI